ncbi:geranylgeranyl transferase type-1 subunit beta [Yamadazyma tenuis]|uniref:Terpenoid cyclases/Protein prenyltransferase n=1 Tax=Candida tenuis (strain ATCC 10573 / BCRC 21748 / CBS 615 / JCM 9827 / NBRC 10315 / NRRL Y-1498 / VKM Y-70) TaxID=590646 RepID=G3B0C5_CANTC|nr:uncharacterized protein CANTEDRAFT_113091 [Yamadazyma tenuis ATCC 10573]XP_006685214.1 terpenoid cyclases/Protein prenyltransferase [Yamadazyma tenuis ATCC 10573]EGV65527.1 hypothetical protein CANTEDRAFT_113091 [Yamadazyma tenuis ATCC 10573]EGV65528.1 terpenoid cyclases/Protein prenyltransferase [Yamadazyma tenuis ATCC 10573]WEJ94969.1 geranylgeranyl transferase type-1 subunit beta [Yamadazyma tenuis]
MNQLLIHKHVKYFTLCLNMLPSKHQDQDNNKLSLICFCLEGLELLNGLGFSDVERAQFSDFIYNSYYTGNGFRAVMNPSGVYDIATMSSTFFGLQSLLVLRDTINEKVDRHSIMKFVQSCQWKTGPDKGCFAPTLNIDGTPFGDSDLRLCYMAVAIRRILKYDQIPPQQRKYDIDVPALIQYVLQRVNVSGGFSCVQLSESHSGFTFCALAMLKLLDYNLPEADSHQTLNWIVHRQVNHPEVLPGELELRHEDFGGFNGRVNKLSDSCYSWWSLGSLEILNHLDLSNLSAAAQFLLLNQDHRIGGIAKEFDSSPDPYHTFLSICSLALIKDKVDFEGNTQLSGLDVLLTAPTSAVEFLDSLKW